MPPKVKPLPGYKIEQLIGHGSYAEVYRCINIQTSEVFAVKVFKQNSHNKPGIIKKEIDIVRKLNHPNIIKCVDVFYDENDKDKLYAAVFEHCGKGNLNEYMIMQKDQKNRVPEDMAKSYIFKILDALNYLHQNKIAHRDLKLANILLNDQCDIKLADFGLSRQYEEEEMLKSFCGTPLTMAPEIFQNTGYTQKCDTWSFGVISYYLLFSEHPFNGRSHKQLLENILTQKVPPFPSKIKVSDQAKTFLKLCLTINPQKRPSIEELQSNQWFRILPESKIRSQFMKNSFGDQSETIQKINSAIVLAINTEIYNLIMLLNLTQSHINAISKGFQEFYPEEKWKLFMFYFFIGKKLQKVKSGKLQLKIASSVVELDYKKLNIFENHINEILETSKSKVKLLDQSFSKANLQDLQKSYKDLVRFVIFEGNKLIEDDQNNIKKMKFFKNLMEFLNTEIQQPCIKITLRKLEQKDGFLISEIQTYASSILNEQKIYKMIDCQDIKSFSNSANDRELQNEWNIEYLNPLRKSDDTEVWRVVSEVLGGALKARMNYFVDEKGLQGEKTQINNKEA